MSYREKLIEALKNAPDEYGAIKISTQIRDIIVEELEKDLKWISVKERLPEDDGAYLVYTLEKYIEFFWFDRDEKEWIEEADFPCLDGYVTHWMPRPEPPKEDANETD